MPRHCFPREGGVRGGDAWLSPVPRSLRVRFGSLLPIHGGRYSDPERPVTNGRHQLFPRAVKFRFLRRMSLWFQPGPLKMHELSIAQGLVEAACEALARCEPAPARVGSLRVRIGALSGVVPEALEFCYGLTVEGTPLAGSRLVIEEQPVVVFCPRCLENRTLEAISAFAARSATRPLPSWCTAASSSSSPWN